jgi:hypothetical protein
MFILSEYAACVLVVFMLGTLLFAACGIGYLLKVAGKIFERALRRMAHGTPTLKRIAMRFNNRNVAYTVAESSVIADCPS